MKKYEELLQKLADEGRKFVFSPDFVREGTIYSPTRMIVPSAVPPDPEKAQQLVTFFKGEDLVFVLPILKPGESGKFTLGYVMISSAPVFQKFVSQRDEKPITVVIQGSKCKGWNKGTYLWDFFRFTGGSKRAGAQMVASGSIQIQETVGARTLYTNPSVADVVLPSED